jgi:hypothetical protein
VSAVIGDAEAILRRARRPLVLGMGGGGDVVGALATAEFARLYDGADPILGGLTWERLPIDPKPGARDASEIAGAVELAPRVLLAGPDTRVRESGVLFAESRMAAFLGAQTVLVDVNGGPGEIADGLAHAATQLGCDLVVFVDVGGDVLSQGDEPGLRSPLCDAMMLAAAARLGTAGHPVLAGIFGLGCDGELTIDELSVQLAAVAAAGGLCGARGLTAPIADRLEKAMETVPTEASAQAVRAFHGARGRTTIRGGVHTFDLTPLAAATIYLDVQATFDAAAILARAVTDAHDLEHAHEILTRLGVPTELGRERAAASSPG